MDELRKLIIALFCLACTFFIHIWVMSAGWGLSVKSWQCIFSGYILTFLVLIVQTISMKD